MEEAKLGLVKRIVYAFTCLFGSKEEIKEIILEEGIRGLYPTK